MFHAVVTCASSRWYSIALKLGFHHSAVERLVWHIPDYDDRLQRFIDLKVGEVGEQETAALLLQACRDIPNPIIGMVEDELEKYHTQ